VIGWIVGTILYRVIVEVVKVLRIDDALKAKLIAAVEDFKKGFQA